MKEKHLIKSLDELARMNNSGLTKLPIIPNTAGTYTAQYLIDRGLYSRDKVIIIRVYPNSQCNGIGIYFLEYNREDMRNMNSLNYRIKIENNEHLLKFIISLLGKVNVDNHGKIEHFNKLVHNLIKRKKNPYFYLEQIVSKLMGKDVEITTDEASKPYRYYNPNYISNERALEAAMTLKNFIEYSSGYGGVIKIKSQE